jgi:PAS domain S-box-containing protein
VIAPTPAYQASVAGTRGLWSRLAWPLLLACSFLVFVSASSIYLVISSQSSREMTNQALRLENELRAIIAFVRIAESEQRGYLLTGDPHYLEIYSDTISASAAAVAEVRMAVADNPAQRRALAEIDPLIASKFAELRETMRLHDAGDDAAALALVRTGVGLDLMTRIRVATVGLIDEQRHLVSLRTSNSVSTNIWLLLVNLAGLALIIALSVFSVRAMRRTAGKELAQSESRGNELRATADQRHKTEQKFKEMLEAAPDAMVVVNQGGEIILLNLQAEKQFGYRRNELLGQKVTNIIPDGFAERLIADGLRSAEDALAQQIGTGIELIGKRRNGAQFPIEIMLSPLESAEGILVTAAIRDISVRKDAERHLAQMEARYRGLLEAAPDAIVVVNQGGEIILLNLQAEQEFGYRRDELLGQKVTNIIPDGFAERLIADGLRSAEDALAQQIGTGIELTGRRKDGAEFPIEIMLSPLESTEGILVTAAIRDISVRKQAEKHLAQMEARYRGLLEAAPDAMVVVNQGGEIILLNLQAEQEFGYRRDELLGQKVTNIIPDGFAERLLADRLRSPADALAQQIGTGIELTGRRKDGAEFPIEIMLSPLQSTEGILVTAAIRDISVRKGAERHLAQMEARYRGLLEAAPDAMVVVNQGGEIILLNLQAEKEFGYRRDELLGQQVTNIIPDGFAERLVADGLRSPADALAQQIGTGIELIGRRKDGAEFPIEIMLSPLESAEGILVTAAIRDISVRKGAERHLAQMEERSRGLLEAAPDAMVVVNRNAEIVLVNLQAKLEFGYRRVELLGQKVTRIIPEGFAERLLKDGVDAMAQQILKGIDFTGRRKKGDEFPIEIMLSPLESGEGILVIRDISLRKDEERRVARMESRYRGLLQAAPDAMVVVNHDGEIVLANLQAEKEFGYGQDELLGQNMENIIPEGFAERLLASGLGSTGDALTLQIAAGIELTGQRKDRSQFPVELMLSPLESAEGILVIRDISARKHNERLKDEFVSTVSHELRTPLTSISGSLGLLAEQWASELPKSAARLLAIAHTNSQRLVRLINDILDIEKLESSRVVFNLSQVDLRLLVTHAIDENRGFAESYGVHVRLDNAPADCAVNADPDRLAQVVTNLLSNAIKFSPTGGEILVALEKNGNVIRVSVRDHGCGIPDDFKPHVFEKFAQADGTTSRQKGGTGLGLSIVKQIVERLGGDVGFDDAPGGGTIFHVDLQAWDDSIAGEVDLDSDPSAVRILLCEDDRDAAIVLRKALRRAGYAVDFAYTMSAGVARTEATRYAAILVDLKLPGGDGIDLILQIRANAHHRDTPVLVIAGDPDRGRTDVRSSHLNILDWLRKPLDFERLVRTLGIALAPAQPKRLRVLHVDDDHDVLALVTHALRSTADVISADSLVSARRALATERIDVVVLDMALGTDFGTDLLPSLRDNLGNALPVIVFAKNGAAVPCDEQVQVALSKSNASLEVLKDEVRDRLALLPRRPVMEMV